MEDYTTLYEKLDLFYLGKKYDIGTKSLTDNLLLYKNTNFTTHAAIIGMTGSGKTGLGIGIIEEAVTDNIPVIIIDPKGDMGNLLLTFPDLKPEDFLPWIDPGAAESRGISKEEYAKLTAEQWKKGIEAWHQDASRIKHLKENAEYVIYTPGSTAGVQLSVLSTFDAPNSDITEDPDSFNSIINSTVSSILSLINVAGNSLQSKEYLLLSNIFVHFWKKSKGISLEELIGYVTNPPFDKIGVLPLNSIYNQSERLELAMKLNTVLASPGFSTWTEGETLDINNLIYTKTGKNKVSVISIAHLDESQRMFFVTLFLNRYISWMRQQKGTSSLRTILYMDEVFGFFPAVGNPPSKTPMLLLLKQARAFGSGIVLATQNPIDLDYKGLSNIGTWFIGRLQTKQDKDRLMAGLLTASNQSINRNETELLLSGLQNRIFLMKSVYEDQTILMQTRHILSYLRGPLSKEEIKMLMMGKKDILGTVVNVHEIDESSQKETSVIPSDVESGDFLPVLSPDIRQFFSINQTYGNSNVYSPYIIAQGKVRFTNPSKGIDIENSVSERFGVEIDMNSMNFEKGVDFKFDDGLFSRKPIEDIKFKPLPSYIQQMKNFISLEKSFSEFLFRTNKIELYKCPELKVESKPNESVSDFQLKLVNLLKDKKADAVEALRKKYGPKGQKLQDAYNKLMIKLEKEKADNLSKKTDTAVSFGMAVLDTFLGSGSKSKAVKGINQASKLYKENADVNKLESELMLVRNQMEELKQNLAHEIELIKSKYAVENLNIETFYINATKSNIYDVRLSLLWLTD